VEAGVTGGDDRKAGVPQQEQPHGVESPVDEASAESFPASDAPAYGSDDNGAGAPHHSAVVPGPGPSNPVRVT
ncbi:hypothetical protein NGM37_11535, partial [Streptomyces sp. TRM76130]|nr:hypothetical protein [Streptomyces sp. TRM76130]